MMATKDDIPSMFSNTLNDIQEEILKQFSSKHDPNLNKEFKFSPQMQVDTYIDFLKSLPYHETWMILLMVFHLICLITVVSTRKYYNFQYTMFFFLLLFVGLSEKFNEYAAGNWKLFAKENYFDSNGLFVSTVYSTPILFNCVLFIILWLKQTFTSMVKLKKQQILHNQQNENNRNNKDNKKSK